MPEPSQHKQTPADTTLKKPEGYIYFWLYQSLLLFRSVKADMHQHYPIEIYLGLEGDFKMDFGDGFGSYGAVVIETDQPHQFDGSSGWCALMMIDPMTKTGESLRKNLLKGRNYATPDTQPFAPFKKLLFGYTAGAFACVEVEAAFNRMLQVVSGNRQIMEVPNQRMVGIMKMLRRLPEKKMPAAQLAEIVNLSESRLAHVFKEGAGMPVRRFLLWLKLIDAVKLIISGMPYTEAAYEAGFADHAHLTRTYKKMFGLTLSHVFNDLKNVDVITYF